jgi:hypothetical protein
VASAAAEAESGVNDGGHPVRHVLMLLRWHYGKLVAGRMPYLRFKEESTVNSRQILGAVFLCCLGAQSEQQAEKKPASSILAQLFIRLNDRDSRTRESAVEELALSDGPEIVAQLRGCIAVEKDFHVRLALHYALAMHGDKEAFKCLWKDAGSRDGHLGGVYCAWITQEQVVRAEMPDWINELSTEQFQKRTAELRRPRDVRFTGRDEYFAGVTCLQERGDRAKAAEYFRAVVVNHSQSVYFAESRELADLLEKMIQEDVIWKEPADRDKLSLTEKIAYNVYHLRNVNCHQTCNPGRCSVFCQLVSNELAKETGLPGPVYNAAIELREIGVPAIPALIGLLSDRRPLRSTAGLHISFILRYEDAAFQILEQFMPTEIVDGKKLSRHKYLSWYFSSEEPEAKQQFIADVKRWYDGFKDRPLTEQKWIVCKNARMLPTMRILRSLAIDDGQKGKVLVELHRLYRERHWALQPVIANLMVELGDTSKVSEIRTNFNQGKYYDNDVMELASQPGLAGEDVNAYGNKEYYASQVLKRAEKK